MFDHFFDRVADGASEDGNHYGMVGFLAFFSIIVYYNWLTGIDLARLADLPLDVLVESRRVAERLAVLQTSQEESSESRKIAIRRKALLRVIPLLPLVSTPTWLLHELCFCGRCYPVDTDILPFFLESDTLVHHMIAPDAINSSVRTFCSTR